MTEQDHVNLWDEEVTAWIADNRSRYKFLKLLLLALSVLIGIIVISLILAGVAYLGFFVAKVVISMSAPTTT